MNKSYSKIRHIQESNQLLERRLFSEQVSGTTSGATQQTTPTKLGPEQLNSLQGQTTKKWSGFFNNYYKTNIPLDGNWLNPDYNKTMERYLKEKNLPVWVCKTGDGYCNDSDNGVITTKDVKNLKNFLNQDSAKLNSPQQSKINTTNDKSYDYKLENGKYYYSAKDQNKWIEATGNGLNSIKTKVKF
jgi:hypothetical protein